MDIASHNAAALRCRGKRAVRSQRQRDGAAAQRRKGDERLHPAAQNAEQLLRQKRIFIEYARNAAEYLARGRAGHKNAGARERFRRYVRYVALRDYCNAAARQGGAGKPPLQLPRRADIGAVVAQRLLLRQRLHKPDARGRAAGAGVGRKAVLQKPRNVRK